MTSRRSTSRVDAKTWVMAAGILGIGVISRFTASQAPAPTFDPALEASWAAATERHDIAVVHGAGHRIVALRAAGLEVSSPVLLEDRTGLRLSVATTGYESHLVIGTVWRLVRDETTGVVIATCAETDTKLADRVHAWLSRLTEAAALGDAERHALPSMLVVSEQAAKPLRMWEGTLVGGINLLTGYDRLGAADTAFSVATLVAQAMVGLRQPSYDPARGAAVYELAQSLLYADGQIASEWRTILPANLAYRTRSAAERRSRQQLAAHEVQGDLATLVMLEGRGRAGEGEPAFQRDRVARSARIETCVQHHARCLARYEEILRGGGGALERPVAVDLVEAPLPDHVSADAGAGRVAVAAVYGGMVEDCGCKGRKEGGFARLIAELRRTPFAATVFLGNMLPGPRSPRYHPRVVAYMQAHMSRAGTVWVPGLNDVLSWDHTGSEDGTARCKVVLSNVERRDGGTTPWSPRASLAADGQTPPVEVFGFLDLSVTSETAGVGECLTNFRVRDPSLVLAELLAATPLETTVWICGNWIPPADVVRDLRHRVVVLVSDARVAAYRHPSPARAAIPSTLGDTGVRVLAVDTYQTGLQDLRIDRHTAMPLAWAPVRLEGPVPEDLGDEVRRVLEQVDDGSPVAPVAHHADVSSVAAGNAYVGVDRCATCHAEQYAAWQHTGHAKSMLALESAQRHRVRSCYVCHVTGDGVPSGHDRGSPASLAVVGCEACHGPGQKHAASADRGSILRTPDVERCELCHTPEHSEMSSDPTSYWASMYHNCVGDSK
ncbi:MAG: cytochrome c family protein [Planctomycetota bacterium]